MSASDVFGEVISSYSRAQAIEDGVLVDISGLAREAGFRYPVAVSRGVFAVRSPDKLKGATQNLLLDCLMGQELGMALPLAFYLAFSPAYRHLL